MALAALPTANAETLEAVEPTPTAVEKSDQAFASDPSASDDVPLETALMPTAVA